MNPYRLPSLSHPAISYRNVRDVSTTDLPREESFAASAQIPAAGRPLTPSKGSSRKNMERVAEPAKSSRCVDQEKDSGPRPGSVSPPHVPARTRTPSVATKAKHEPSAKSGAADIPAIRSIAVHGPSDLTCGRNRVPATWGRPARWRPFRKFLLRGDA